MKIIITGSTGLVGKGVLLECLDNLQVDSILALNRTGVDINHDKLTEIIVDDFLDLSDIEGELEDYDACFFCLGVSSTGMTESSYSKITCDMTLCLARILEQTSPNLTFCFVSGVGTDTTEKGKIMWARVKGKAENALLALSFKSIYLFRPAYINPERGTRSKTKIFNLIYAVTKPFYPLLKTIFPNQTTSNILIGKAMIALVNNEYKSKYIYSRDINLLANGK